MRVNKKLMFKIIGSSAAVGIVLALLYVLLRGHAPGEIAGICLGFVTGIFGAFLGILMSKRFEAKNPRAARTKSIAENDERIAVIRDKAGATVNKLLAFILPAVTLTFLLLEVELAATLIMCALILLQAFLTIYFHYHFNKRM